MLKLQRPQSAKKGLPTPDRGSQEGGAEADALVSDAERLEAHQTAEIEREAEAALPTYESRLQTLIEAKQQQVERIESRLEVLIGQQETRLQRLLQDAPGGLALPSTRHSWKQKTDYQRLQLQRLHNRLERVQSIREGMGTHRPKLEELATRRLRFEAPGLAAQWDEAQAEARRKQMGDRGRQKTPFEREKQRGLGLGLGKPE